MKRSTAPARKSPRTVRVAPKSAEPLTPPVKPPQKGEACVLPVPPYVPSLDQDLECYLLTLRDCLTKMRQTELTDRAIRQLDRTMKLL